MLDRSWTGTCVEPTCRHSSEDHLATPELSAQQGERIVWCRACRHHETVRPSRFRWNRIARRRVTA